jgi:nicotinamidase-related amidase
LRGSIAAILIALSLSPLIGQEPTIIDDWSKVQTPPPPALQAVKLEPATTALLLLDFEARTVSSRARAAAVLPRAKRLLELARSAGMVVAFSNTGAGSPVTILPEVAPLPTEHVVKASVDKFYGTDLEDYLKGHGVKTVIIAGIVAEGAVLNTSVGATLRGFKVIVPVDGTASSEPYAEQYVAWQLANAPALKGNVTLTKVDMIGL